MFRGGERASGRRRRLRRDDLSEAAVKTDAEKKIDRKINVATRGACSCSSIISCASQRASERASVCECVRACTRNDGSDFSLT